MPPPADTCRHSATASVEVFPQLAIPVPATEPIPAGLFPGLYIYPRLPFDRLEKGPVDHEVDFKCRVYDNGRVAADRKRFAGWQDFRSAKSGKILECGVITSG